MGTTLESNFAITAISLGALFDTTSPKKTWTQITDRSVATFASRPELGDSSTAMNRHGAQFQFTRGSYRGVYDILSRVDFERLGGFSVVWLVEG
jgi:hypothetical protein